MKRSKSGTLGREVAGLHTFHLQPTADPRGWLHRHFLHARGQTWNAWCAIASGMQENGCYVISPLLLPPRLLWMDFPAI
ncbi:hypothetical protein E1N52_41950 [Paraburkholderia guartelaensis]|uniref:Uncharacterized protein n=1 Tax=Paraburkholderia guartelaensis TaxID=2546446 RepID=A0A4R5L307_9BURK|nr:hypothetical protein [Paraburkholderia guartelaensis]TDG02022.1 hypothetical protein E1N52_41950 [Paraburkholderia guartelaensis]